MVGLQATLEVQRTLVFVLALCGTRAFALSGAMAPNSPAPGRSAFWCSLSRRQPLAVSVVMY
jgi:hypothetical protein